MLLRFRLRRLQRIHTLRRRDSGLEDVVLVAALLRRTTRTPIALSAMTSTTPAIDINTMPVVDNRADSEDLMFIDGGIAGWRAGD